MTCGRTGTGTLKNLSTIHTYRVAIFITLTHHSSSLLFFAVLIRDDDSVMNSRLDEEDTKQQSPDFFSSEDSNTSFEDDVSDGSSVPLFVALRLVGASAERISIRT